MKRTPEDIARAVIPYLLQGQVQAVINMYPGNLSKLDENEINDFVKGTLKPETLHKLSTPRTL